MNKKIKSLIIILFIVFALGTPLIFLISSFIELYKPPPDDQHPTDIFGFNASIYIDGNKIFASIAASEGWSGNGSIDNPFIIEEYNISASTEHGIGIRNTNLHFIVQNVSIINGRSNYFYGLYLLNVSNGIFKNNSVNNNLAGFLLINSSNNFFIDNKANNNMHGFRFWDSNNNTVLNSTINNNLEYGIYLDNSNYNNITGNSLFFNEFGSIVELDCVENYIEYNVYNPETFFLASSCGRFDGDGTFNLTWSASAGANNYTLFQNGAPLAENMTIRSYTLTDLPLGTYRYYVRAFNPYGEVDSNTIKVTVKFLLFINGNLDFHQAALDYNFTGNGSLINPYLIENYEIDATVGHGVYIKNTNLYFIIRSVTVYDGASNHFCGFYLENVTHGLLEANDAYNNLYGFYLKNSFNNTLIDNTGFENINGLALNCSNMNNLTSNIIIENRYGFSIEFSSNNSISSNQVKNNTYLGFYLRSSLNNTFKKNNATWNLNGFTLSSSNFNVFMNNSANYNDQHGFRLLESHNNTIIENSASYNQKYGIYLEESASNTILRNILVGNGIGAIYERIGDDGEYPDVFLIAAIIFIIGVSLFIVFKCYQIASKKGITLKMLKKFSFKKKKK